MIENQLNFLQPPLQTWEDSIFTQRNLQVNVLRLDKMHPLLGGNKWMKLRGFLQQALTENKAGILTKGGPWSNHIHACAWACKVLRLPLQVWIKGHAQVQTAMLADVVSWGAQIHFINRVMFYDEAVAQQFASENNLLYIPMGGADERGVMESSHFLQDLNLPKYDYAVCAVGTATTFGGLAFMPNNFSTVIGIDVGTNDGAITAKVTDWQQALPYKKLVLNTAYSFGGFAKRTTELVAFANRLHQQKNIPTDIIYTAKLFYAIRQLAQQDYFAIGSTIMILHSGGLQGNRSLPVATLEF